MKVPSLRFVEKTVIEDEGQSDPWILDQFCPRKEYWHCQGRLQLLKEAEDRLIEKVTGEAPPTCSPEYSRVSLPGCTTEGINYVLECSTCQDKGCRRQYWGEKLKVSIPEGNRA